MLAELGPSLGHSHVVPAFCGKYYELGLGSAQAAGPTCRLQWPRPRPSLELQPLRFHDSVIVADDV